MEVHISGSYVRTARDAFIGALPLKKAWNKACFATLPRAAGDLLFFCSISETRLTAAANTSH